MVDCSLEVATSDSCILKLDEVMELRGEVVNFASFLRVSCTRYLAQREARVVPLALVGRSTAQG